MSHELPPLRHGHPAWRIWASAQGRLYATRPGMPALIPGAPVTVDSATADGLSHTIAAAERDARRAAAFRDRFGNGR